MSKRKRITKRELANRDEQIAQRWQESLDGMGANADPGRATELTAKKFGVNERTVQRARRNARQRRAELERVQAQIVAAAPAVRELLHWITKADTDRHPDWGVPDFELLAAERARAHALELEVAALKKQVDELTRERNKLGLQLAVYEPRRNTR